MQKEAESIAAILSRLETSTPETLSTEALNGDDWCAVHNCVQPCQVCDTLKGDQEKAKQAKVNALMPNAQIGKRYHGMTFDNFKPCCKESAIIKQTCIRYADTFGVRLKNCDSLLMIGNPGTGKNMLAACICKQIMGEGYTALHTTALKLVRNIKDSWRKGSETSEQDAINKFLIPDLLVVDEIGVQFGSSTEQLFITEVVMDRHENMRPTILLSNLSLPEVENYIGFRAVDRFYEGKSAILKFTWGSFRRFTDSTV